MGYGDDLMFLPQPFPPTEPPAARVAGKPSPWEALSNGKTIGKRIGLGLQDSGANATSLEVPQNMFEVNGPDSASLPLTITLLPPQARNFTANGPLPNISDTQTNAEASFSGSWFNPVAIIEWGTGGVSCQAEVDIHNGAKICLSASFVRISGALESPPGDQGGKDYMLSAFISPGYDKGLGAQRTITNPIAVPAAVNTQFPAGGAGDFCLPVPAFSRRVTVTGVVNGTPAGYVGMIRFFRDKLGAELVCEYLFSENNQNSFFIPAGSYYFAFVTGVANITAMQAIFDLAI